MVHTQWKPRSNRLPTVPGMLPELPAISTQQQTSRMTLAPREDPIIISSDDEEENDQINKSDVTQTHRPSLGSGILQRISIRSRVRSNSDRSPTFHFNSKRQKIENTPSPTRNRTEEAILLGAEDSGDDIKPDVRQGASDNHLTSSDLEASPVPADLSYVELPRNLANPRLTHERPKLHPPYYDDPKLKLRMYRGPGYEKFPVPLELNQEHERICREWDDRRGIGFNEYLLIDSDEEDQDDFDTQDTPISPIEQNCIQQICEILPDIEYTFVVSKVRQHYEVYQFDDEDIEVYPDLDTMIAEIMEEGSYPKNTPTVGEGQETFVEETGRTIKWDKGHTTHHHYIMDSDKLLGEYFNHVPMDFIHMVMTEKRSLWDAFLHINSFEKNYFQSPDKPYDRYQFPRQTVEPAYNRGFDLYWDKRHYASLVNELQAVKQHAAREVLQEAQEQRFLVEEEENLERNRADRTLLECQCCFDDEVPLNRSVMCTAPMAHSFCYSCTRSLANNQLGLMKYEMSCMDSSGCTAKLAADHIAKAIPVKTLDRLALNQQQAEIAAAKLEGLEQCPMCDFKAIMDPIEVDSVFNCQNPECLKATCRKCQQPSHLPRTCEEVKQDQSLQKRHLIEEARSQAMIRTCPNCRAKIIKEYGCNKMQCTCGTIMCYVCKADLSKDSSPYTHFDGNGHVASGGEKCPLHDRAGIDRHAQDANAAENKAIEEVKALDPTVDDSTLRIETNKENSNTTATTNNDRRNRRHRHGRHRLRRRDADQHVVDQERPANNALLNPLPPIVPNPFDFQAYPILDQPVRLLGNQFRANEYQPNANYNQPAGPPRNFEAGLEAHRLQRLQFAQEQDNNIRSIETAGRIQGFRNEIAQRRQLRAQRGQANLGPAPMEAVLQANTPWRGGLVPHNLAQQRNDVAENPDLREDLRAAAARVRALDGVNMQQVQFPPLGLAGHFPAAQRPLIWGPFQQANNPPGYNANEFNHYAHHLQHRPQFGLRPFQFDFEARQAAGGPNNAVRDDGGVPWHVLE